MSNSTSSHRSRVQLSAAMSPVEIRLLDEYQEEVTQGCDRIDADLPAGRYVLEYGLGALQEQEFLDVRAGEPYERHDLEIAIPSAAPIEGSRAFDAGYAAMAAQLSREPSSHFGTGGRLMIFARSNNGPVKLQDFALLDESAHPLAKLSDEAMRTDLHGWAGVSAVVNPGGYVLRWRPIIRDASTIPAVIDQSLWVSEGWITMVFFDYDAKRRTYSRQASSIHMAPIDEGFDHRTKNEIYQATELILYSLRAGETAVPSRLEDLVRRDEGAHPMLAILGLHALLQQRDPDQDTIERLCSDLTQRLPQHPDARALQLLVASRFGGTVEEVLPVSWPPMLSAGFRAIIAREWETPTRDRMGGMAEMAASSLLQQGPWSCWLGSEAENVAPRALRPYIDALESSGLIRNLGQLMRQSLDRSEMSLEQPSQLSVKRVTRFLTTLAAEEDRPLLSLKRLETIGLPSSSVSRALWHLDHAARLYNVATGADTYQPLRKTDWLVERLNRPDLRIIECSSNSKSGRSGLIPGSVTFDWHKDLQDQIQRDTLDKKAFEELMQRHGITPETTVVIYGDERNLWAAYAYWVFQLFGHTNAALLDGGLIKWRDEERPIQTPGRLFKPKRDVIYQARERDDDTFRVFKEDVKQHSGQGLPLVDVRSPEEFRGKRVEIPGAGKPLRGGHIPGAQNLTWEKATLPDGTFKSPNVLHKLFKKSRIEREEEIILYCAVGERSSHTWFALTRILGFRNVRNYDGSWGEWGNTINAPIKNPRQEKKQKKKEKKKERRRKKATK